MAVNGSESTWTADVTVVANPAGPEKEAARPRKVCPTVRLALGFSSEGTSKNIEPVSEPELEVETSCSREFLRSNRWKMRLWLAGCEATKEFRRRCSNTAARAPSVEIVVVKFEVWVVGELKDLER